jgi:hypothetical protein
MRKSGSFAVRGERMKIVTAQAITSYGRGIWECIHRLKGSTYRLATKENLKMKRKEKKSSLEPLFENP